MLDRIKNLTTGQIVLAVATAIGSWGMFPAPPMMVSDLAQNEMVRYALLFTLIWQGGAGQDPVLAGLITAAFYALNMALA